MLAENAGIDIFCVDYYKKMSITTTFNPDGFFCGIIGSTGLQPKKEEFLCALMSSGGRHPTLFERLIHNGWTRRQEETVGAGRWRVALGGGVQRDAERGGAPDSRRGGRGREHHDGRKRHEHHQLSAEQSHQVGGLFHLRRKDRGLP